MILAGIGDGTTTSTRTGERQARACSARACFSSFLQERQNHRPILPSFGQFRITEINVFSCLFLVISCHFLSFLVTSAKDVVPSNTFSRLVRRRIYASFHVNNSTFGLVLDGLSRSSAVCVLFPLLVSRSGNNRYLCHLFTSFLVISEKGPDAPLNLIRIRQK